ncbi:hypothetical protein, partial [Flavobacterium sp.]|uniref:hypothetical protein n=1 Tax=Flavobacterium sp. TaxID=239 RepID=UPI00374D2A80
MKNIFFALSMLISTICFSQKKQTVSGQIIAEKLSLKQAEVILIGTKQKTETDSLGNYSFR